MYIPLFLYFSEKPPAIPKSTKPVKILLGFSNPNGIAVSADRIYVADMTSHEVIIYNKQYERVGSVGGQGIEEGKFFCPRGVAIDHNDDIIITSAAGLKCVHKFTAEGKFIKAVGKPGTGDFEVQGADGIAIGKDGKVYICDVGNNRVQILTSDLEFLGNFSSTDPEYGSGCLNNPSSIAVMDDGNVLVADMVGQCIQMFSPDGKFLTRMGRPGHTAGCITVPMCVATNNEMIYVGDGIGRVSIFNKHGIYVSSFGGRGQGPGEFSTIKAIAVYDGMIYTCELTSNRVQIFL